MRYLAFDMGAESGRAIVGTLADTGFMLEEVYRFPNEPVLINGSIYWDALRLFHEMKKGLHLAVARYGSSITSMAVDTWGVDFALLGENDMLLGNPYHYRDKRTQGMLEKAFSLVPRDEIFQETGVQFMPINTLYQLLSFKENNPNLFAQVRTLLMMPDLFNYFFTGVKGSEITIASTSQMYNPIKKYWAENILELLEIPVSILPPINPPGTILGILQKEVAAATGSAQINVVVPGSHDTASAVAAVPASGEKFLYISSGTWSLVGVELAEPIINQRTMALNFTNEAGLAGTIRFLRNIVGLWLIQECRRVWQNMGESYSYDQITDMARQAEPLKSFVDPDHELLLNPDNMPSAIQKFCRKTNQKIPRTRGEIVRCAIESLALKYRWVMENIQDTLEYELPVIHMVGGGTKNELLCQFTANACNRVVFAGPIEATAIGNILVQAMASGVIGSLAELRSIVKSQVEIKSFEPRDTGLWEDTYQQYIELLNEIKARDNHE